MANLDGFKVSRDDQAVFRVEGESRTRGCVSG